MKEIFRHIIGYFLGIFIFLILIPLILFKLSEFDSLLTDRVIINYSLIRYIVSILFFIVGVYFALWSNIFLLKIGKGGPAEGFGISVSPKTKKLVTTGPYKFSRNPMVFGAFSLYVSIVIFLNSIVGLSCLLIFLPIGIIYLKLSEEKRLMKDFGDEYIDYRKKVSMIFPVKRLMK